MQFINYVEKIATDRQRATKRAVDRWVVVRELEEQRLVAKNTKKGDQPLPVPAYVKQLGGKKKKKQQLEGEESMDGE